MKVLLATDGSDYSTLATRLLSKLKSANPLQVHVLSVVSLEVPHGLPELNLASSYAQHTRAQSQRSVDLAVESLKAAGIAATHEVIEGHPAVTIVEKAAELGVDLVILGAQGHSLLARLLLGSVSDYVATHADCSVLVVRETEFLSGNSQLKICIGFDDSQPCNHAIDELAELGWAREAKIDLVSAVVLPVDNFSDMPLQFDPQDFVASHQTLINKAVDAIKPKLGDNVFGSVEQCAHVGLGLSTFVEREKSDVLVVGDKGRSFIARFLLGSVSRSVLHHAPCSIWIARAGK